MRRDLCSLFGCRLLVAVLLGADEACRALHDCPVDRDIAGMNNSSHLEADGEAGQESDRLEGCFALWSCYCGSMGLAGDGMG